MNPIDEARINGEKSKSDCAILSSAYASYTYDEDFSMISSNVYQLLSFVVQNNTFCKLLDFALPKVHTVYPSVAFLPLQDITSPTYVLYPDTHVLTEADEILIDFMKIYIQNLRIQAKEITKYLTFYRVFHVKHFWQAAAKSTTYYNRIIGLARPLALWPAGGRSDTLPASDPPEDGYRSGWWRYRHVPAFPEWRADRHRWTADGWRRNAAAHGVSDQR